MAVMMPYSTALYSCADWFRQLWAESLGKQDGLKKKKVYAGQTPIKALAPPISIPRCSSIAKAQRQESSPFLEVEKFQAPPLHPRHHERRRNLNYLANSSFQTLINNEKIATEYALMESDRPTATVIFPAFLPTPSASSSTCTKSPSATWARSINQHYDQPGVSSAKKATFALMGRPGYEKMKKEITPVAEKSKKHLI